MTSNSCTNQIIDRTSSKLKTILFLLLFSIISISYSQTPRIKAFPSAEGFGKYATGGRGGAVIKVTNLNDSGPGSLRQALQYTKGPRTIIFEVGGTISLKSVLPIKNGNVTIAGQTAPGGGILIKDGELIVESSNVIIRHLRFRYGTKPSKWDDSLNITAWGNDVVENIVIDHCSISWGRDENFSIKAATKGTVKNITLQNSIVSEGGKSLLLYGPRVYNISLFENLLANNRERNIRSNYPSIGKFHFEMINNIVYGFSWGTVVSSGSKFAVINNLYKKSREVEIRGSAVEVTAVGGIEKNYTDAYVSGNSVLSGIELHHAPFSYLPYLKKIPFSNSGIIARKANQIEDIIPHVGASLPKRDAVDSRIIQQYKNGNGSLKYIGTYPTIQNGKAEVDTDDDGMPDAWEVENGLNPNDARDRNYVQPDGYTNLEYYLNGLTLRNNSIQNTKITADAGQDIDICEGSSTTLTAAGGSSYRWNTGATTTSIKVSPDKTTTYTVTAYDTTGKFSDTDEVKVTVNPLPNLNAGSDRTINVGETVTLTASGAQYVIWSTGDKRASTKVSPTVTTTYYVRGKNSEDSDCEVTDEVKVTVRNSNAASVKANAGEDQTICQGNSVFLIATGGSTYLWSTGERRATIEVSPNQTTTYTVTAFDKTGERSSTDNVTVKVNPLAKVNAGKDVTINVGESVTLKATGARYFMWSTGDKKSTTTVSPKVTTTYTLRGKNADGCEGTDTVKVTVRNAASVFARAGNDQTICQGSTTTLTATGGAAYLWNTGERTQSIEVSPNTTTKYSVKVYDYTGKKSDTDEVTVKVNPLAKVNAGKDVTINAGDRVTLRASGARYFLWSTGDKKATTTVSPTVTTTYYLRGKNGDECEGFDSVKVIVLDGQSANRMVKVDAGRDQEICDGSSVTLTAVGGVSYLWSTGATTSSINVSPNKTTTYSVTAYDRSGNNSESDDVTVKVNPAATVNAGGDVTINAGERVTLKATGARYFMWSTGDKKSTTTVSPTVTTTYYLRGKNSTNGCEGFDSVKVLVRNNKTVASRSAVVQKVSQPEKKVSNRQSIEETIKADAGKDITLCKNESTTLTANGPANSFFLWSTGETTKSISVSPSVTTEYSVKVYDADKYDTDEVLVTVQNCSPKDQFGNAQLTEPEVSVYPNPTSGHVNIRVSGINSLSSIHLFDLSGKSLFNEEIKDVNQGNYSKGLDLSDYDAGIYILQLIDDQKVISKKIILK